MYLFVFSMFIGPSQSKPQSQPQPQSQSKPQSQPQSQSQSQSQSHSQSQSPAPANQQTSRPTQTQQQPPQIIKYIPDNELMLWKQFSAGTKIPINEFSYDMDTTILYLNSPYFSLVLEGLLGIKRVFVMTNPKGQIPGLTLDSISSFLEAIERLWTNSSESIPKRKQTLKTMEDYWADFDREKRSFDFNLEEDDFNGRNLMICKLIVDVLRAIIQTRGSEISQLLAKNEFIKSTLFHSVLLESNDWELYKDTLSIFEALSPFLMPISVKLLNWSINQCKQDLIQVRTERLSALSFKMIGLSNLDRLNSFDNLSTARHSVSYLINQCSQLWRTVPSHLFLQLCSVLNLLTTFDDVIEVDLEDFSLELEKFMDIFIFPTVSLLRAVRTLYDCSNNQSNQNYILEVSRILDSVIYSSSFSLTDGGFLELCLQLLNKFRTHQSECLNSIKWTGLIVLLRELRDFWRHGDCAGVTNLGNSCYQHISSNSPAKKSTSKQQRQQQQQQQQQEQLPLLILSGSSQIIASFSHPFMLLIRSLELFSTSFSVLPDSIKMDLLELSVEWNLGIPSKWGKEVLGSERIEDYLKIIREFYCVIK